MKSDTVRTGMKIGAVVGGVLFLVFGVMAGFYFGSYGTLIILQKLMGGTVEPTLFVRAAVVMGIIVGIAASAVLSIAVCGLAGAAMGFIVSAPKVSAEKKASVNA